MKVLKHPRAGTVANDFFVGQESQFTVDTDRWELRLHDNVRPGGHRILSLDQLYEIFLSKDSEFGNTNFAPGDRGWLTRIGHREWALREFIAGTGMDIQYPNGFEGNPVFNVVGLGAASRSVLYAGLTTGTAAALTIPVLPEGSDSEDEGAPEPWADVQGGWFLCKIHVNVSNEVTLSVNGSASRQLRTMNDSRNLSGILRQNTVALIARVGDHYYVIGAQHPQETGILPIEGLDATNVQDALEELLGQGGGGGDVRNPVLSWLMGPYKFSPFVQVSNPQFVRTVTHETIDLEPGQCRLVAFGSVVPPVPDGGPRAMPPYSIWQWARAPNGDHYAGQISSRGIGSNQQMTEAMFERWDANLFRPMVSTGYTRRGATFAFPTSEIVIQGEGPGGVTLATGAYVRRTGLGEFPPGLDLESDEEEDEEE